MSKSALGKGLGVLVPDSYMQDKKEKTSSGEGISKLRLDVIVPKKDQPRKHFKEAALKELAESIKEKGVLQPIVVKKLESSDFYEIICGERRYRASKQAGLEEIPVVIVELDDQETLEVALIENIQREDLSPIEEAKAYSQLHEIYELTHDSIAKRVGKDRATVSNAIRLLKLPADILDLLLAKKISNGHARALLAIPTEEGQRFMASRVVKENLSVRQLEDDIQKKAYQKRSAKPARQVDPDIVNLEESIQQKLGVKVKLSAGKKNKGKLEIRYQSLDELDRILDLLGVYR